MATKNIDKKALQEQVISIFKRFQNRELIESELGLLGFSEFFGDPDEKIYFTPERVHDILVYVNWIDCQYWIYQRTIKEVML